MDQAARAQEVWSQLSGRALETMTVWTDANQRLMKEWFEFSTGAAKEGLRLYGEMQMRTLDGLKALADGTYGPQAAFHVAEENVQALTRIAERLQATAEQATKGIQATVTDAVAKTKEIYGRAA